MICPVIDNPTSCEIRAVIRFLHAKCMSAAEIHRELCAVYGQNVMSEGTVRQRRRMFKDWRKNIRDEERSGRPSVADSSCFLGQEKGTDSGIHATRDHNNVRSVLRNTRKVHRAIQEEGYGMLASGVVLLHDNARPHSRTVARTRALLDHFNWELFDYSLYSPDLCLSDYHLFTYLRTG
jgi:hypothetical protein